MRDGVNPEKYKNELLTVFQHRVIVPLYIPNLEDEYYKNQLQVFEIFLDRLIKTINPQTTVITLINNNSCAEITSVIEKHSSAIDKLIVYNENKGKVFPVLQEARSVAEPFVTITDADVLFYEGWEEAVFDIFVNCPKAGVVAPLPSPALVFYENSSVFADNYLLGGISYEKKMSDSDADIYLKGMGNDSLLNRENHTYSWKERHYVLKGKDAIVGCGHFVATYRSQLFKGEHRLPEVKFKNGLERIFIDSLANRKGFYRLSTVKTYAYHMANNLDKHSKTIIQETTGVSADPKLILKAQYYQRSRLPYSLHKFIFRVLKRFFKL